MANYLKYDQLVWYKQTFSKTGYFSKIRHRFHMKISHKIAMGITVIAVALIGMGYISLLQLNMLNEPFKEQIPATLQKLEHYSTLDNQAQLIKYYDEVLTQSIRNYAFTQDEKWLERYKEHEPKLETSLHDAIKEGDIIEAEFFKMIEDANHALSSLENEVIMLVRNGNSQGALAILDSTGYQNHKEQYQDGLQRYITKRGTSFDDALFTSSTELEIISKETTQLINQVTERSIFTIMLVVSVGVGFSFFILHSITNPITKLKNLTDRIADGKSDVDVSISGDQEINELATSIQKMVDTIKKSEDLHRIAEFKYKSLYEEAPEMYRTVNGDGIIINCNKAYAKKLGYDQEEIIGKSIYDFVAKESLDTMKDSFDTWKKEGEVQNRKLVLKRKDGSTFRGLLSSSSVFDEDHNMIVANTLIRDVTDLENAQKEIEDLRQKRLSVVGELTARIAHDLRNPLSVIKNTAEILHIVSEEKFNEQNKEHWERLERAIYRMTHQVEDVLDYVRAPPLHKDTHMVSAIIQDSIDRVQMPENITVHPPKSDAEIYCDSDRLEIVFVNLIMNAIQAFEGNYGQIFINVSSKGDSVKIEISDTGPGISPEHITKIFDPLFTTRQIGTGLGLPSCKNIVERHEGTLSVSSTIGKGSVFTITMPKPNAPIQKNIA